MGNTTKQRGRHENLVGSATESGIINRTAVPEEPFGRTLEPASVIHALLVSLGFHLSIRNDCGLLSLLLRHVPTGPLFSAHAKLNQSVRSFAAKKSMYCQEENTTQARDRFISVFAKAEQGGDGQA
eukprot:TRINITY_DN12873_c0_g1_i3.p1 TRINITY_DN12873_c0_g1~~TRINITY_DN12873_c0_g1_i3.p1  ORF type:complete len:126 (+),score=12.58 TRINITY_DN12873_c0_g1_i3:228-605(+)